MQQGSVRAVQNLESELFLIDILGITSWPPFPRLNAHSSELTWHMYMSETKLLLLSKVL